MRKYLLGLCLFILMAPITAQKDAGSAKTIAMDKEMFMERIVNYQANPGEWNYLGNKPCIIDFYADWCGPCRRIAPILEELAEQYAGKIYIYKVNTDKQKELASLFNVTSLPMLLFVPLSGPPHKATCALSTYTF